LTLGTRRRCGKDKEIGWICNEAEGGEFFSKYHEHLQGISNAGILRAMARRLAENPPFSSIAAFRRNYW
jgi:hypothetical protein